MKQDWANANNN